MLFVGGRRAHLQLKVTLVACFLILPAPPGPTEYALVNQYAGFHVVTQRNMDELRDHCPRAVYLTNPVDMRRFTEPTSLRESIVFEWNGNAQHGDDVKGLHGIIAPAVKESGASFVLA